VSAKKIACLGGGSLYFRNALTDLLARRELAGSEIVLYDIDAEKVELMAAMGRRLAEKMGAGFTVRSTDRLADAVDGADFAVSSIGGSGAEISANVYGSWYHAADMYIPARYGITQVIGDTCGPAGMMMALRAIPAYIDICREMEKRCPKVILFSHSNPMACLCRAMRKYTDVQVIGVCHGVQNGIRDIGRILELPPDELECVWVGTNHYYWYTRVVHQGNDMMPELMRRHAALAGEEDETLSNRLSRICGYPIRYAGASHLVEFYPYLAQTHSQQDLPEELRQEATRYGFDETKPLPPRPEPTAELRAEFLEKYQTILDEVEPPVEADGQHASQEGLAAMIGAIAHGRREVFIVNLPNGGLVSNLPTTALIEVEGVTDSTGMRGIQAGHCPPHLKGILEKRFVWQEFVVDAAAKGDRNLALQALLIDEMAVWPDKAEAMLEELLEASRDLLPQFFERKD
jgi:alpha-galactosidase